MRTIHYEMVCPNGAEDYSIAREIIESQIGAFDSRFTHKDAASSFTFESSEKIDFTDLMELGLTIKILQQ